MTHFKNIIFDIKKHDMTAAILKLINEEREGRDVEKALIRLCIEVYETMGMDLNDGLEVYNAGYLYNYI